MAATVRPSMSTAMMIVSRKRGSTTTASPHIMASSRCRLGTSMMGHTLYYRGQRGTNSAPLPEWYLRKRDRGAIMRNIIYCALLIPTWICSTAASADTFTGNDLLPACRDFVNEKFHINPLRQGQCIGIIDALSFAAPDQPSQIFRSCPPDTATVKQVTTVVVRWMERHPQNWHEPFFALVFLALHETWPCPER
jgi:Rap1a immunity proteins